MKLPTLDSVSAVLPIIVLGVGLVMLIVLPVPSTNHDVVLAIVSGVLGYLAKNDKPTPPPGGVA